MGSIEQIGEILGGRGQGCAIALLNCPNEAAEAVAQRWPTQPIAPITLNDPCRTEHPHSAFVRKPYDNDGKPALRTMLYAPDGRLTEERLQDGTVLTPFLRKPRDTIILRGYLRDVEQIAGPRPDGCALALLGQSAGAEFAERWLGGQELPWIADDEAAASCLRKLDRLLRRRGEQTVALGYRAGLLCDRPQGSPEDWVTGNRTTMEALRQIGLPCYVEPTDPTDWPSALRSCHAGLCANLYDDRLAHELPRRLRLLLRVNIQQLAGGLPESAARRLTACERVTVLIDCAQGQADIPEALSALVSALPQ